MSQPTPADGPLKLAVLISGSGRTLKNFIDLAAEDELPIAIKLVIANTSKASGLQHAGDAGIPMQVINRADYPKGASGDKPFGDAIFAACREAGVEYVAMADFLKLAPVPPDFAGR